LLCAPDHPDPADELAELIRKVRAQPVDGDAFNANGDPLHVRIDERALLDFVVRGNFTTLNEVLAASVSLDQGDPAPLLRLAAEGFYTVAPGDSGDPTIYSRGAFQATGCSDVGEPWKWSDPIADRMQDYNEYIASLPIDYFSPFTTSVGKDIRFSQFGMRCFWWQEPTPSTPIAPPNAAYPSAPTLVLSGDIDNIAPTAANQAVAALFPNSTFVEIVNSYHETTDFTQCGATLANTLIETLSPGDTSCASTPEYIWPAVGRFPILAKDARPAVPDTSGANQIGEAERKVVSVAVATAVDALERFNIGSGSGVGLRGGSFTSSGSGSGPTSITLTNCQFSQDIVVNGTIVWNAPDGSTTAVLAISGPATAGGNLQVSGYWEGYGPVGYFQVSGTLGGKNVTVLVPEG
jgi:pimeloyl-ACP methyl ester carboxylesterase